MKTAVVLFNLGGPDSLNAVRPFLYNLFSDKAIIGAPTPIRQLIAHIISQRRSNTAKEIYEHLGGKSPILEQTELQSLALKKRLESESPEDEIEIFISMRYWKPFVEETIINVEKFNPQQIVLLPLYPQFSTTTTGSAFNSWWKSTKGSILEHIPTVTICSYPSNKGLISAQTDLIREAIQTNRLSDYRLLLSAHGLPKKIIQQGDPYQKQVEKTASAIVEGLGIEKLDWCICYQSRVGPLEWIGPATEDEIKKAGKDKKNVMIVPIAFISEHSETLVELDIEYLKLAKDCGVEEYHRVPTVGTHEDFISGLANLVGGAVSAIRNNKLRNKIGPKNVRIRCPSCDCISI
ncbi:MAG: ferrochelatase [Alphaproteobacteria bacterium]|nr:ferrochelatase [Alphaproteobacteria bacterium]|tara:strand:+ start:1065 stop:2111 length:1047 start_codon:yes stop_codon:yes gene_type:complete